ncbi:DsbA family protein [Candidatus Woesearchaeota archaeon]|nr:DsbA family protein [Candidatus Woesearchaeota archaeon]
MDKEIERLQKQKERLENTYKTGIISEEEYHKSLKSIDSKLRYSTKKKTDEKKKKEAIDEILDARAKPKKEDKREAYQRGVKTMDIKSEKKQVKKHKEDKDSETSKIKIVPYYDDIKSEDEHEFTEEKKNNNGYGKKVKSGRKEKNNNVINSYNDNNNKDNNYDGPSFWGNFGAFLLLLIIIVGILFFVHKYTQVLAPQSNTITIYEYSDFFCPYSAAMQTTLKKVKEDYGVKVKIYQRQFPNTDIHPLAKLAAEASECADDQNRFIEYHNQLFFPKKEIKTENDLINLASDADIENVDKFKDCLLNHDKLANVEEDIAEGKELGVKTTPTLVIDGELLVGAQPYNVVKAVINKHLKG